MKTSGCICSLWCTAHVVNVGLVRLCDNCCYSSIHVILLQSSNHHLLYMYVRKFRSQMMENQDHMYDVFMLVSHHCDARERVVRYCISRRHVRLPLRCKSEAVRAPMPILVAIVGDDLQPNQPRTTFFANISPKPSITPFINGSSRLMASDERAA